VVPAPAPAPAPSPAVPPAQRLLAAWNLLVLALWLAGPFLAAGDPWWARGWAHLALLAACWAGHRAFVARRNPMLLERRRRIGPGTQRWDLLWNAAFWPLMAAIAVTGGLGARGRSPGPAWAWAWPAGAALVAAGFALSAVAMAANPFFEGTVRIQLEAGQRPISAGPYARIRHPGYAGLSLWALGTPLLLGSALAVPPALAAAAWVALRTALEDRLLLRELPGYAEYAARVRSRLVPFGW